MTFSSRLLKKISPAYQEIARHPFNVELSEGTLSKDRFEFYIRQDISYLEVLSHVFMIISKKAESSHIEASFLKFSLDAEQCINDLKKLFLHSSKHPIQTNKSPACRDYSDYLLGLATTASLEEAIASVFPCFWMYRELSREMARSTTQCNPYLQWILLNTSQEYSDMTELLISFIEEVSQKCSEKVRGLMESVCEKASHFEFRFWDDAYNMQVAT